MSEPEPSIRPTDLAKAADVTIQYASQLLNGERSPSLKVAQAAERELGIPMASWPRPKRDAAA